MGPGGPKTHAGSPGSVLWVEGVASRGGSWEEGAEGGREGGGREKEGRMGEGGRGDNRYIYIYTFI